MRLVLAARQRRAEYAEGEAGEQRGLRAQRLEEIGDAVEVLLLQVEALGVQLMVQRGALDGQHDEDGGSPLSATLTQKRDERENRQNFHRR